MNDELTQVIAAHIAAGKSKEEIRAEMIAAGHAEATFEHVYAAAAAQAATAPQSTDAAREGEGTTESATTGMNAPTSAFGLIKWGVERALNSGGLIGWSLLMNVVGGALFLLAGGAGTLLGMSVNVSLGILVGLVGFTAGIAVMVLNAMAVLFAVASATPVSYWDGWKLAKGHLWSYLVLSLVGGLMAAAGFVLFVIPGIILAVYFVLAQIVFAREGRVGIAAYARSYELIKGNWWGTVGRGALFMLLVMVVSGVIGGVLSVLGPVGTTVAEVAQFVVQAIVVVASVYMLTAWYEHRTAINTTAPDPSPATSWLRGLMWFGVVVMVLMPVLGGMAAFSMMKNVMVPPMQMDYDQFNELDEAEIEAMMMEEFEAMMQEMGQ